MGGSVHLLGSPAVRVGGEWEPLRPSKPNAVLAYLVYRGARVRRSEVAALLWPEASSEHAQAALRQALRSLSSARFGQLLERDRGSLWVQAESDVERFRLALTERRWRDAFEAHAGPLLEGFELDGADEFASWLATERSAVSEDWRRACRALLHEASGVGDFDEAQRYADLLVRADPFDEQATREAMALAAAAGDVHGAVRRYEALSALLQSEVGVAPESATTALVERLRGQALNGVAASVRTPPLRLLAPHVASRRSVVGRAQAKEELLALLQHEDVRLITLLGPGGVGKSTLAAALIEEAAASFPDGVFVAPLHGLTGSDAVALAAARAAGIAVSAEAPAMPQVVPVLGWRRALLVLDGFESHVAEVATVDALVRGATRLRVLVTSRVRLKLSTEVVFEVEPLATRSDTDGGLSPAAELFRNVAARRVASAPDAVLDLAFVERVAEALGGHPLALELAASWVDVLGLEGLDEQVRRSWALLRSDDVDRATGLHDVHGAIEEVWQQLAPEDRVAWARVAVMPGSLDRVVAAEVAGTGWRGVRRLLDRAVLRHRGERLELHALLDRFGYERAEALGVVDDAWRAALEVWRVRVATELDARTGRRVQLHASDVEQALGAWRWALEGEAWEALADMAVGLMRALDQMVRRLEREALVAEAVTRLEAAQGSGRDLALARLSALALACPASAADDATRALRLAGRLDDDIALGLAHAALACGGPPTISAANARAARAAFERAGDTIGLATMLTRRGNWLADLGHVALAGVVLREAFALHHGLADQGGLADVHDALANAALVRGDLEAAREHVRVARALCAERGTVLRDAGTYATEAWEARVAGDPVRAAERIEAFAKRAARVTDPSFRRLVLTFSYHVRFGPRQRALELGYRLLTLPGTSERVSIMGVAVNYDLAFCLADLGRPDEAAPFFAEAVRLTRLLGAPRFVAHGALVAAALASADEDAATAQRFAALAWHHTAFEFERRRDVEALLARWRATEPAVPLPFPSDEAILAALQEQLARLEAG